MSGKLTYLGEIFQVTEEHEDIVDAVLTKGRELGSQRIYFESADFEVKGSAILERHEILSPNSVPERLRLDNILLRHHNLSTQQAQLYQDLMVKADFTYAAAISQLDHQMRQSGVETTLSWLEQIATEMAQCDVGIEDALHSQNRGEAIPPTYGFHKIDNIYENSYREKDWLEKQPLLIQRLITTPKRCRTIEQLAKLGKKCYQAQTETNPTDYQQVYLSLSNSHQEVFWTEYNARKRELLRVKPKDFSDTSKGLISLITKSDDYCLGKMKARLVRIQKGQMRIRDPPSPLEWNLIWNHYKQREYELKHPLPEVPDGYCRCGYCYQKGGAMYRPKIDLITGKREPQYNTSAKILHCLSCDGR
jgi:hypothetical protein